MTCKPGWSDWINNDQPIPDKKDSDVEPLPLPRDFKDMSGGVKKIKSKVILFFSNMKHSLLALATYIFLTWEYNLTIDFNMSQKLSF